PPSQLYRLRKLVRRHRLQFAAAGMIFATVLVGAIVATAFAVEATAQKNEAESSLARWTRLADRRRLEPLSEEAAGLWPATPERLPALRDWLARAQVLAARLDGHRAALRQLRAQAIDDPPATQAADRAFYWAEHLRLEEIAHAIQLVDAEGRAALQRERETLEATVAKRHTWLFASNDLAFRHGQLQELVADLELFATAERSELLATVPDVTQRRAQAEQLRADAQRPESVAAWDALRADVARPDSPYRGLDVVAAPIPGLVPLGVDRDSGLWELYHTRSGAAPTWDGEPLGRGRVVLSATSDEGIVLVLLPGGSFRMGAEAAGPERGADQPNVDAGAVSWERPVHEVTLDPFLIGKYEVTRGQWERLFGPPSYNDAHEIFWRTTPRHPIADVTWRACDEAARRWDLILPTEAQWEYACRAGTTTAWFTGNASRTLRRFANVGDTNAARPVGELRPNAFGLHDVHGNVAEWCRDELVTYELPTRAGDGFRGAWTDPPRRKGALRGGFAGVPLQFSRSATRGEHDAASPTTAVGVRVARPLRHRSR
ncbi:MAG: SUMF1/EgtB/PvdO family nonheme iron enzyme, partial [Planctomycetota bacterium]